MQANANDFATLLTTEVGRLAATFLFFYFIIKPIKCDIHSMAKQINTIFIKLAESKGLREKLEDQKENIHKIEGRLHHLELQCPGRKGN